MLHGTIGIDPIRQRQEKTVIDACMHMLGDMLATLS